jgi:hypothetical protein
MRGSLSGTAGLQTRGGIEWLVLQSSYFERKHQLNIGDCRFESCPLHYQPEAVVE